MVTVDGQKMGKSLNNFITLKQAFSGSHERLTKSYSPLAVRQLILNSHYRSPLDFSDAALFAAQSGYEKITETVKAVRKRAETTGKDKADEKITEQLEQLREKFEVAMNDDLNTSVALSVVFEMVRLANGLLGGANTTAETFSAVDDLFSKLGGDVLGIIKGEYGNLTNASDIQRYELAISGLVELRNKARREKNFAISDEIRKILGSAGIVLEDKPDGTTWRFR